MDINVDKINLLIAGDKSLSFGEAVLSLERNDKIEKNSINVLNLQNDYFEKFLDIIDGEGNYFNIIAINYKTKTDILNFFYIIYVILT